MKNKRIYSYLSYTTLLLSAACTVFLTVTYLNAPGHYDLASLWDFDWMKENVHQVKEWGIIRWVADLILSAIRLIFA